MYAQIEVYSKLPYLFYHINFLFSFVLHFFKKSFNIVGIPRTHLLQPIFDRETDATVDLRETI